MTLLSIQDIEKLIPHRYPMLLIDRFVVEEPLKRGYALKNVTMNEWFFPGHFPGYPLMPGVLVVEAMAQGAGVLVMHSLEKKEHTISAETHSVYFLGLDDVRFRKPITPGDQLKMDIEVIQNRGNVWRFSGKAYIGEALAVHALFAAMFAKKDTQKA